MSRYRLLSAPGILAIACIAIVMGWAASSQDLAMLPVFLAGSAAVLFLVTGTFIDPFRGLLLNLIISFFVFLPQRVLSLPYSLAAVWEIHVIICFLAYLVRAKGERSFFQDAHLWKNPITWLILACFAFLLLEIINPNVPDLRGWLISMRRYTPFIFAYLSAYFILDSLDKIRAYFKCLLVLIFLVTLYAYYQQFVGLPWFDLAYLHQPGFYQRMYVWGVLRKFSFLDVVTFPVLANIGALILLIFTFFEKRPTRVLLYLAVTGIMVLGSVFSGTRSANFLIPAGLLLYSVLNMQKPRALLIYLGLIAAILLVINLPIYRFTELNRYRSAFKGGDASLEVRNINRMFIQPYIHSHPIGGGLASAGLSGGKLYPAHPLADFPPDSGHLLSALEKGWVGYGIDMLLYLMILIQVVKGYFRTRLAEHRKYFLAIGTSVFSLVVAEYAQIVVTLIPVSGVFFTLAAMTVRLRTLDNKPETLST